MKTIVEKCFIVSIIDDNKLIGDVLWATIIKDQTLRLLKSDYVCSSRINSIDEPTAFNKLIITNSKRTYQYEGTLRRAEVTFNEFALIRQGFRLDDIYELRKATMH